MSLQYQNHSNVTSCCLSFSFTMSLSAAFVWDPQVLLCWSYAKHCWKRIFFLFFSIDFSASHSSTHVFISGFYMIFFIRSCKKNLVLFLCFFFLRQRQCMVIWRHHKAILGYRTALKFSVFSEPAFNFQTYSPLYKVHFPWNKDNGIHLFIILSSFPSFWNSTSILKKADMAV